MSDYLRLKKQIEKLQKEADVLRRRDRAETISKIKEAIIAFELTKEELGFISTPQGRQIQKKVRESEGHKTSATKQATRLKQRGSKNVKENARNSAITDGRRFVAPKYRDPATGATWTGRGKQPKWLSEAVKGGKGLVEDFKI